MHEKHFHQFHTVLQGGILLQFSSTLLQPTIFWAKEWLFRTDYFVDVRTLQYLF